MRSPAPNRTPLTVGLALALVLAAAPAAACTCDTIPSPDEAFAASDGVFEATVDFVRPADFDVSVDLVVQRSWKGVRTVRVTLRTFADQAACGFPFQVGATYLVYATDLAATGEPAAWRTGLCTRTRPIGDAAEDLAFLSGRTIVDTDESSWSTLKARYD